MYGRARKICHGFIIVRLLCVTVHYKWHACVHPLICIFLSPCAIESRPSKEAIKPGGHKLFDLFFLVQGVPEENRWKFMPPLPNCLCLSLSFAFFLSLSHLYGTYAKSFLGIFSLSQPYRVRSCHEQECDLPAIAIKCTTRLHNYTTVEKYAFPASALI